MVDVVSKASVLAKDNFEGNLLEVYFICICVDKKTRCVFVHCIHVHESVGRCDLSFCQRFSAQVLTVPIVRSRMEAR